MALARDDLDDDQGDGFTRFAAWTAQGASLAGLIAQCRPRWFDRAACRGMSPELFYPAQTESGDEARAVCAGCAVRGPCESLALANSERYGIWGGRGARDRREALRAARVAG